MEQLLQTSRTIVFLEPDLIVKSFGLTKGDHVAEFGAGHGYFVIPMARIVGGDGKVYAIDIQKEALDIARTKAQIEHLLNIEFIWADLEEANGSKLKEKFIDFVLIANILFQSEKKEVVMKEAYRVLREEGRLAVIEWKDDNSTGFGPPENLRLKKDKTKGLALEEGFEFDHDFDAGNYHYGLLFVKK